MLSPMALIALAVPPQAQENAWALRVADGHAEPLEALAGARDLAWARP